MRRPLLLLLAVERPEALEALVQYATDLKEPPLHVEQRQLHDVRPLKACLPRVHELPEPL